jgi:ribosome biogenesis GTPase
LGWDQDFEEKFKRLSDETAIPARVIADYGAEYLVHDGTATKRATARRVDPGVGDWVALHEHTITAILDRRTVFSRKQAGIETKEQILAANVDIAFVVAAATDINPRRIERYLTITWQSGAAPIVLLTKSDLTVPLLDISTPYIVTSSVTGEGLAEIEQELKPAKTAVLLGPSGVGKSTLINRILGTELMRTREIHGSSGEGRHMTSHRQLVQLPQGGMIIDTPGLREAQLWEGEDALGNMDIDNLARNCRFNDCTHQTEPGCAVKDAIANGSLDPGTKSGGCKNRRASQKRNPQEVEADLRGESRRNEMTQKRESLA